jgi:hypothetical protein
MLGYAEPGYAESLREFGEPRELPFCGGHLLVRNIGDSPWRDAMGPYPLFACLDWSRLNEDLSNLDPDIVSVALVCDPFGAFDTRELAGHFDRFSHFKGHYVTDLSVPVENVVPAKFRYNARKALREVEVEACEASAALLDDWERLYAHLRERHEITGIRAFSRSSFSRQLQLPGMFAFRAVHGGEAVGMELWLRRNDVAYSHLSAASPAGYALRVAYALRWTAANWFAGKVSWLDQGGGAGVSGGEGGLDEFKKGWGTGTRPAYFCGKVVNREAYDQLSEERGQLDTNYFPAYSAGEFK